MSDITCPNCSASLPAGAAFCTNCGHRMEAAAAPPTPSLGDDPTRVEQPGLGDATEVIPPTTPPAAPWQPAAEPAAGPSTWSPPASTPPAPAPGAPAGAPPWAAPGGTGAPTAPGAPAGPGGDPGWGAPATPPSSWGAPPQGQPPQAGAPAWGTPAAAPAAASAAVEPSPLGGGLALLGGALAVIGLFLGWFKSTRGGVSTILSGWDLASSDNDLQSKDPYIILALGVVGLAVAILLLIGKLRPIARIAGVVIGVALIGVMIRDWLSAADVVEDVVGWKLDQQVGFFLPIAGGALLALGALLPAKKA